MGELKDIKDKAPNEHLISSIENLLKRAKSGEVRSLFYVAGWDDDGVSHGWQLDHRTRRRPMLSEMVMAQHDFVINIELTERDSILAINLE